MIDEPVLFRDEHEPYVREHEALSRSEMRSNYWSDDSLKELRSHVKSHYIRVQAIRCCYCNRMQASEHHRLWDVEHVVPRSTHPQFMFVAENMAASCVDCNQEKGETQVLVNPSRVTYPQAAEQFKIVHPHFDQFDKHIYRDGHVYLPKSDKGNFTIRTCNLLRFAQKYIDWPSVIADSRFEGDVDALLADGPRAAAALGRLTQEIS